MSARGIAIRAALVVLAPVLVPWAFLSKLASESASAWWFAGNAAAQEWESIADYWRQAGRK